VEQEHALEIVIENILEGVCTALGLLVLHFLVTYFLAMFFAILHTPEEGFEWELAWEATKSTYSDILRRLH
jgi:hypothetical protein